MRRKKAVWFLRRNQTALCVESYEKTEFFENLFQVNHPDGDSLVIFLTVLAWSSFLIGESALYLIGMTEP